MWPMPTKPSKIHRLRHLASVAFLSSAAFAGAVQAASTCLRVETDTPHVFQAVWKVPTERIAELREAYRKLKAVTGLKPRLSICGAEDVNALAIDSKIPEIQVFTGLMLAAQNADEMAAVL